MVEYLEFTTRVKLVLPQKPLDVKKIIKKNNELSRLATNQTKKQKEKNVFWPKQGLCWMSSFKTRHGGGHQEDKNCVSRKYISTLDSRFFVTLCVCVCFNLLPTLLMFLLKQSSCRELQRQEPLRHLEHCDYIEFPFFCETAEHPLLLELILQKQIKAQPND